jgi:uncharacterized alkaline shock family protein YloU
VDGRPSISPEVVSRYVRDAVREVPGVARVVEGVRKGVRVEADAIELHLAVEWGASIPEVGAEVQRHVGDYLARMAAVRPAVVNVVVEAVDGGS